MKNTVVVSFENQTIRVIDASLKGSVHTVKDVLTLKDTQLGDFLRSEKTKEFIVVSKFRESYQDTINVPVVKKKYLEKIIEIEIRKKCPFRDFSYLYHLSGEKIIENRKSLEIFVFAVKNNELTNLIRRFTDMGKTVRAVYPDVFSLSSIIRTDSKYALCVSETGINKNLFLINDRKMVFVREAQSLEAGMTDFDMRNVEMTLNYCRQTLRINPSLVVLTGNLCKNFNASLNISVPVVCLVPPPNIQMDSRIILEHVTAISALCSGSDNDIAPREYKEVKFTVALLRYSTATLLCLIILSVFYTGIGFKSTLAAREEFQDSYKDLPDIDRVLTSYEREVSRFNGYRSLVASFESSMATPDILDLLNAFTRLKGDKIRLDSINVSVNDGVLKSRIEGAAVSENYAEAGAAYERFTGSFDDIKGLTIIKNVFELKERKLFVEADYR